MSTLPILLPCSYSGHTLTLKGIFAVVSGLWVNPRHRRGPRNQVTALANHGTSLTDVDEESEEIDDKNREKIGSESEKSETDERDQIEIPDLLKMIDSKKWGIMMI